MADVFRHPASSPQVSWATLLKIIAAGALVYLWFLLWPVVMLLIVSLIVAVGLAPAVSALERHRWPRWLAASTIELLMLAALIGFLMLTWTSLSDQAQSLRGQVGSFEEQLTPWVPLPVLESIRRSADSSVSTLAGYAAQAGRVVLNGVTATVLGFILVLYLLIEEEQTYQWVRAFIPEQYRTRFDRTAREARDAAYAYVVGNVVTSIFAGTYVFVALVLLKVPGALILATIAFVCDFIPVLGFFFSLAPAMIMAASVSGTLALLIIPVYLFYHLVENYFIGPYVYGNRLRLSNVAVLLAFTIGAELAGVVGALVALPLAAIYPSVERVWLGDRLADDVVEEHARVARHSNA